MENETLNSSGRPIIVGLMETLSNGSHRLMTCIMLARCLFDSNEQ